jgi:hypothetical protein
MKLTAVQKAQLESKNISPERIAEQLSRFEDGFPVVKLHSVATINDGIIPLKDLDQDSLVELFDEKRDELQIVKFVPASGAATRMFKFLHEFLDDFDEQSDSINSYINRNKAQDLFTFFSALEKFPFYDQVLSTLKSNNPDWDEKSSSQRRFLFIQEMVRGEECGYASMPKGLVPFHKYKSHIASAFAEHLFESTLYASCLGVCHLHFTISPAHEDKFQKELESIITAVETKTKHKFEVSFSFQKPFTDTIAVDKKNRPILQEDGTFLFRPAGHGALLENLNQIDADLIFIKNIDNVTVSTLEDKVCRYKKLLAGQLLNVREKIFNYHKALSSPDVSDAVKNEVEKFILENWGRRLPKDYTKFSRHYQIEALIAILDRPLRICGMVKNEGEPGGGPFWVAKPNGELSLEIVESAQVDRKNKRQKSIANSGTHFNPVDLVCSVKNYEGEKYDLHEYSDPESGFITSKSRNGKDLKALELPGLWNGGMSGWNTIFVEVPLITFNPVKTVNDLLKPAHQLSGQR